MVDTRQYSILMIDDHPMIVEGYQNTLSRLEEDGYAFNFSSVHNCDDAVRLITEAQRSGNSYDMLLVDVKLPPSTDGNFTSGEDLVVYAKRLLPNSKIIMLTMFMEGHRLYNILKTADPDGLVVKSDLTSDELITAFLRVQNDPPYYSRTVEKYLRKTMRNDFTLDDTNRKILYYLSQGIQTRHLSNYIELSLSAIEKRKRQIKEKLNIEDGSDESLLIEARKRGFI